MTLQVTLNQFVVFMLILSRVTSLVMVAPAFGSRSLPLRMRAFLSVALAALVAPVYWGHVVPPPGNLVHLALLIVNEVSVGVTLGFGLNLLFTGIQLTGQIVGQMSGMQLADIFNPTMGISIPLFSQLLDLVMLTIFIAIGGHLHLMGALLDTFHSMPPGDAHFRGETVEVLVGLLSESFRMGIRISAPVMIALLMSILIMGLISRTLPQLNVIQVGFSMNSMVMMFMVAGALGAGAILFQHEVQSALQKLVESLGNTRSPSKG